MGTMLTIHAVLDDAEERQMTDKLVKVWLDELRDLAYDVEDNLDSLREFLGVSERVLQKVSLAKGSPQPNAPQPSQRAHLGVSERVLRKVSLAKGSPRPSQRGTWECLRKCFGKSPQPKGDNPLKD
nr:putative disease resistance rpp13-like protein 1 [Quercus suber]